MCAVRTHHEEVDAFDNDCLCLLALTRWASSPSDTEAYLARGQSLERVNWTRIAREAIRHRVGATVWVALTELGLTSFIAEGHLQMLVRAAHTAAQRWQLLEPEAHDLATQCEKKGISAALVRGPALAPLYQQPGLRYFKDFDVLVAEEDLPQLHSGLKDLGYVQGNVDVANKRIVPPTRQDRQLEDQEKRVHAYLKPFAGGDGFFIVEPHTQLFAEYEPYRLSAREMLLSARDASKSSQGGAYGLPAEEQLIELSIHIYSHAISLLSMRMDTDLLLYRWLDLLVLLTRFRDRILWSRVFALASEHGLSFPVSWGLYFVNRLYGVHIPNLDSFLPPDFEERCCDVWYFDVDGRFRPVTTNSAPVVKRMFDRSAYSGVRAWERSVALDDSKVRQANVWVNF